MTCEPSFEIRALASFQGVSVNADSRPVWRFFTHTSGLPERLDIYASLVPSLDMEGEMFKSRPSVHRLGALSVAAAAGTLTIDERKDTAEKT
jgi:hypothetical protein